MGVGNRLRQRQKNRETAKQRDRPPESDRALPFPSLGETGIRNIVFGMSIWSRRTVNVIAGMHNCSETRLSFG